jgi:hypothetical protein
MESLDLARCLENKFGWASLMAVQKGVSFSIKDDSLATEFGPGSTVGVPAAGRNPAICSVCVLSNLSEGVVYIALLDEENGYGVMEEALRAQRAACLQVDMIRFDQVMRNLITNAVCKLLG